MTGKYEVLIIDRDGAVKEKLYEFISISLMDALNDFGAWHLRSRSYGSCPFEITDSIAVYRNGVLIYSGITDKITEEYHKRTKTWVWDVYGYNHNSLLKWKLLFPSSNIDGGGRMASRYFEYTDTRATEIIKKIIDDNLVVTSSLRSWNFGMEIVGGAEIIPDASGAFASCSYRFENVYDAVLDLATAAGLSILPVFDKARGKVYYKIASGHDLSGDLVYSNDLEDIEVFSRTVTAAQETHVITAFNSDEPENDQQHAIWKYFGLGNIPGDASGTKQWREVFYEPQKKEFSDTDYSRGSARLDEIAQAEAESRLAECEGYEITLNLENTAYSYGYDTENGYFSTDYRLGDTIGILFKGEKFTGKLTQISFEVAYGTETIRTTVGAHKAGVFGGVLNSVKNLNKSVSRSNAEVK